MTWLYLAGRGAGKTRSAAEWLAWKAIRHNATRWAIVAPTYADARDTCVEGESGLLHILRDYGVLRDYNKSRGELILTNWSRVKMFSGEEPDRLRGPQHYGGWFDELAAFSYPETWDQYQFGLRLGRHPQTIVTTTPKPIRLLKDLTARDGVLVSRGSTFDNAANLAPPALAELKLRYENTRLGRQELYGELLDDVEGALWTRGSIEASRVQDPPPFVRVVVAIDPAVTSGEGADETGIVAVGITGDSHYYVLQDASMRGRPDQWAKRAIDLYHDVEADRLIGETNNGGDMIEILLRQIDGSVSYRKVTATRGKRVRAEPIAAMWEQKRGHIVGSLPRLEDQLCSWTPLGDDSPDRMDAMVWACTELMSGATALLGLAAFATFCNSCRMPAPRGTVVCPRCGAAISA